MTFHRQHVLKILYDNLTPDNKAKVHLSKKVVDVQTTPDGVSVTCADGSSYTGSKIGRAHV